MTREEFVSQFKVGDHIGAENDARVFEITGFGQTRFLANIVGTRLIESGYLYDCEWCLVPQEDTVYLWLYHTSDMVGWKTTTGAYKDEAAALRHLDAGTQVRRIDSTATKVPR